MKHKTSVLVLGAGIQGVCLALGLRQRGYAVTLLDQMPDCMLRASLRNEGKIHLGFVYANDASFRTAALLVRAALSFAPLLDDWLGAPVHWRALVSQPFLYLVARDSMLGPARIREHFARLQDCFAELTADAASSSYLGIDLRGARLWQPAPPEMGKWFTPGWAADLVQTVEVAIDRHKLRQLIRARLSSAPEIERLFGHRVEALERRAGGFCASGTRADGSSWSKSADLVINCLWEGRLQIDRQLGIQSPHSQVMRLKYRLLGELPPALEGMPSVTMVLGRYGDIVVHPGSACYFSWYPTCMRGWSQGIAPPADWNAACEGRPDETEAQTVLNGTLDAFEQVIPGIRASRIQTVDAGVICARGETDIDDFHSELHQRHAVGFTAQGGYFSVDTGKFTTAPLFARELLDHLDSPE